MFTMLNPGSNPSVSDPAPDRFEARRCQEAFSLVETALALGVIGIAVTALVALLPGGLTQFRDAMDTSIGAQIFQRVVTDVEQMEFDTLLQSGDGTSGSFFALPTRTFDDQGNEVPTADAARVVYHARVRVSPPGPAAVQAGAQEFTSLPAAPGEARFAPRAAVFLTVQIVHHPLAKELAVGPDSLWLRTGAQSALRILTYSTVVTRNGYANQPAQ